MKTIKAIIRNRGEMPCLNCRLIEMGEMACYQVGDIVTQIINREMILPSCFPRIDVLSVIECHLANQPQGKTQYKVQTCFAFIKGSTTLLKLREAQGLFCQQSSGSLIFNLYFIFLPDAAL